MRKLDMIVIAVLLAVGAVFWLVTNRASTDALTAVVYLDGEVSASYPLGEARQVDVNTRFGNNRLQLDANSIRMEWADCNSQDCVLTGAITRPGEVIACLPHRLLVVLEGDSTGEEFDVLAG